MPEDVLHVSGHTDSVEAVRIARMLPLCASAGVDGKLLIWDTASLSVRAACQHPEVCPASLSPAACCPGMQVCSVGSSLRD